MITNTKLYYIAAHIARFKQGVVVRVVADNFHNMIGHVQSFGLNEYMEITVKVLLCTGDVVEYHNGHLEVL